MYYDVMTMAKIVIIPRCSSLKEKQDNHFDQSVIRSERAHHVHAVSATSTCSHDVWNIDPKHVGTRFHGSTIFMTLPFSWIAGSLLEVCKIQNAPGSV
jgi:hypothetical protein